MAWRLIQRRSLESGHGRGALDRVEAYLTTVRGLEEPAWEKPLQTPVHTFPGLTAKAFHDPAEYPGVAKLERAIETIQDEFLKAHSLPRFGAHPQKLVDTGKWDAFHFHTNTRVRCQLSLAAAEKGCEIRVGSETRSWVPGKCMVFDDSFEHEAWNESGAERIVLIVDFWHPELTPCERQAVAMINDMFDSYEKFRRQVRNRLREAEAGPADPSPTG